MKRCLRHVVILAVSFAFWSVSGSGAMAAMKIAPDFRLHDLSGNVVHLEQLRGRWVLLNFWATWCSPCRKEMPSLETFSKHLPGKFTVLGISESLSGDNDLRTFLIQRHVTYRILKDPFGTVADNYGVKGLPDSVLIDPEGRIRWVIEGAVDWTDPVFQRNYIHNLILKSVKPI